ncbi:hypothetical protein CVT24_009921 [Panaeolus cyanescens]|uniref:Uncharacterized protein n=1 Tax=Panaeolus cyanescens TaxID=181874 RepID=A0A409WU66_9AGAR|nr:hypothetical protein CVT24_009921 [Panaeolus cyanescens]
MSSSNIPHDSSSDSEPEISQRQLTSQVRKKSKSKALGFSISPYNNAAAWLFHTYSANTRWGTALKRGISYKLKKFGNYTPDDYKKKFQAPIDAYNMLWNMVPELSDNLEQLSRDPDLIDLLGLKMMKHVTQTRSNDICHLRDRFLQHLALEVSADAVLPNKPDKSDCGFKNIHTARLLVPVELLSALNSDPERKLAEFLNGTMQTLPSDDDEQSRPLENLLRSPILLRTFKHIFITPSSALGSLDPAKAKAIRGLALKHQMSTVTPQSIAHAAVMLRHAATTITEWKCLDRDFDYDDFYNNIVDLFNKEKEHADFEWIDSTIKWWNISVFGRESPHYNEDDNSNDDATIKKRRKNSTLSAIHKTRVEKRRRLDIKAAAAAAAASPPSRSPITPTSTTSGTSGPLSTPSQASQDQTRRDSDYTSPTMPPMPRPTPLAHSNGVNGGAGGTMYQSSIPPTPSLTQVPPRQSSNLQAGRPPYPSASQQRPTPQCANQGGSSSQCPDENIDPSLRFQPQADNYGRFFPQSNYTLPNFYHNHHQPSPQPLQSHSVGQGNTPDQFYLQNSARIHPQNTSFQQEQSHGPLDPYSNLF